MVDQRGGCSHVILDITNCLDKVQSRLTKLMTQDLRLVTGPPEKLLVIPWVNTGTIVGLTEI